MTKSRLTELLQGRTQTEFGDSLGLNRGTTSRIFSGKPINNDILTRIMHKENCSLTWLHGGYGSPYNVLRTTSPKDTYEELNTHLEDGGYEIFLVSGYDVITFIFAIDMERENSNGVILKYISCEVVSGPVGQSALNLLRDYKVYHCQLGYEDAEKLSLGHMGTFELFGSADILDIKNLGHGGKLENSHEATQEELENIFEQYTGSRDELMVNEVIKMVDDAILEEGLTDITPEQRRKLTVELYRGVVNEGYVITRRVHDLAKKILRVVS
ncbi:hypothetical protein FLL45_01630 [Aliikangiella marina]|uniref:Uncharacterized protein n=1 Tax=Aliikangiella marina TaxID=1712262 RepID=A0A545THL5_9GAMM|nr:hypothetical protein [Aliikangiella marina]TQV76688.1 hypothetical protein FLL45_01630 [Aliikangiella marina]